MVEPASATIGLYGVVQILKDLGTQTYRIFSARSAAGRHLKQLHADEREFAYWRGQANNCLKCTETIPRERLNVLESDMVAFDQAMQRYDTSVTRWCRHLCVEIEAAGVRTIPEEELMVSAFSNYPLDTEDEDLTRHRCDDNHQKFHQGRSFCILGRLGFVLYGERRIKSQAKSVSEVRKLLSLKCIAESPKVPPAPTATEVHTTLRESKLMQFISGALERVQNNYQVKVFRVLVPDAQYTFADYNLLDPRMTNFAIPEYALPHVSLVPLLHTMQDGLEPIEHCIAIRRSPLLAISQENYESEAIKLARLFAEDEKHSKNFLVQRSDSDVLRCCGIVLYPGQGCDLLFKLPPGCNPYPRTLRQILTDQRARMPAHPLSDRIKFCIRLVSGLFVIHSLGLVHKRVHPETIIVVEPVAVSETDIFPYRLGHPYLTSLQLARTDDGKTKKLKYQDAISHRGVYFHPRDHYSLSDQSRSRILPDGVFASQDISDRRLDEYRPRDDIFSAGVCLFEVICFRSLLIWKEKPDVRHPDYVHDDDFVPLSDNLEAWKGLTSAERAIRKASVLIDHVNEKVPKALGRRVGKRVAEVVVSFLRAGYEDEVFGVSLRGKDDAQAHIFFLSKALNSLRVAYRETITAEKKGKKLRWL